MLPLIRIALMLLLVSFTTVQKASSQYVTIPDTNFRNYLIKHYPSCINGGGQLDTVCAGTATVTYLNIPSTPEAFPNGVSNIAAIKYFKQLDTLIYTYSDQLTSLPSLPNSLIYLDCSGGILTSLPVLPVSLTYLNCSSNKLTNLPSLPNSLTHLDCSRNILAVLPDLPSSLLSLNCTNNNLYCLPAIPPTINSLYAKYNHIACLFDIPTGLQNPISMDSAYQICGSNNVHNCPVNPNYVNIPDAGFKSYLQQNFSSCMNISGQLDTTCTNILNATSLHINGSSIADFTGIQYFKNIDTLSCTNVTITNWSTLPNSITYFSIAQSPYTTTLPILPESLRYLNITLNHFTSLPNLPASLTHLECSANQFTSLPALPVSLKYLDCSGNQLTGLPTLPAFIDTLYCDNNLLTTLPALPSSLSYLNCQWNKLNCLSLLPEGLTELDINNNNITCLSNIPASLKNGDYWSYVACNSTNNTYDCPLDTHYVNIPDSSLESYLHINFPDCMNAGGQLDTTCTALLNITSINLSHLSVGDLTGIQYFKNLDTLICSYNKLKSLPALPPSLIYLDCSHNQLTSLPNLPGVTIVSARTAKTASLVTLDCENNLLTCLPILPDGLQYLQAKGNHISCLPNIPSSLTSLDSAFQICNDANNSNGCSVQSVTGVTSVTSLQLVEVFPNPSNGLVTINCPFTATGIKICGMDGKIVYETISSNSSYSLNLGGVVQGAYVVQVGSPNGVIMQKLIIQ